MKLIGYLIITLWGLIAVPACIGVAEGDPAICTFGHSSRCVDDKVYTFDSCGNLQAIFEDCTVIGASCVELAEDQAECECRAEDHTRCEDDAVVWYDSCGKKGVPEAECTGEHNLCVESDGVAAGCECENRWSGEQCDVCPPNVDLDSNCAQCLPGWAGDHCNVCVRYASPQSSTGDPAGLTWDDPYSVIQEAVDAALAAAVQEEVSHCEVWLKAGVYYSDPAMIGGFDGNIRLFDKVHLIGGFKGDETDLSTRDWRANPSILSGFNESGDERVPNLITLHYPSQELTNVVVDGLTLQDVESTMVQFDENFDASGAIFIRGSTMTVKNCIIKDNQVVYSGAAIDIVTDGELPSESPLVLENVEFSGNRATIGAAILVRDTNVAITDCTFTGNFATLSGGAISLINVTDSQLRTDINPITHSTFSNNSAGDEGGAIANIGSTPLISGCRFESNQAPLGGAIYNNPSSSLAEVENSVFWKNSSGLLGAAIFSNGSRPVLQNNTFYENSSKFYTGGVVAALNVQSYPLNEEIYLFNSVLWGNKAPPSDVVYHSLVLPEDIDTETEMDTDSLQHEEFRVFNTTVKNNLLGETDSDSYLLMLGINFVGDPLFQNSTEGDFHLQQTSPCIDAADVENAPHLDFDGLARSGPPDIGAYEFQSP